MSGTGFGMSAKIQVNSDPFGSLKQLKQNTRALETPLKRLSAIVRDGF